MEKKGRWFNEYWEGREVKAILCIWQWMSTERGKIYQVKGEKRRRCKRIYDGKMCKEMEKKRSWYHVLGAETRGKVI